MTAQTTAVIEVAPGVTREFRYRQYEQLLEHITALRLAGSRARVLQVIEPGYRR